MVHHVAEGMRLSFSGVGSEATFAGQIFFDRTRLGRSGVISVTPRLPIRSCQKSGSAASSLILLPGKLIGLLSGGSDGHNATGYRERT